MATVENIKADRAFEELNSKIDVSYYIGPDKAKLIADACEAKVVIRDGSFRTRVKNYVKESIIAGEPQPIETPIVDAIKENKGAIRDAIEDKVQEGIDDGVIDIPDDEPVKKKRASKKKT